MPIVEKQRITTVEQTVMIEAGGGVCLKGDQVVPEECLGLVLFGHGSEMSRFNLGSRRVVRELQERGLAVVAFDLLSADEEDEEIFSGRHSLNSSLAGSRFWSVADWAGRQDELGHLPIGLLGVGSAATAALVAAAERPRALSAIVCQNGRVDRAGKLLASVQAPTRLIVGDGEDAMVRGNEAALLQLGSARKELVIIPGASSRFESPAEMETAGDLAGEWFSENLILAS